VISFAAGMRRLDTDLIGIGISLSCWWWSAEEGLPLKCRQG
jgi:hypothetical protein